jgi:glyoxylase I family protein
MKMTLHHLNLTTANVAKMNDFYRNVMGLAAEPTLSASRITNQGYSGETAFATDGHVQVHMSERDLELGFRQKQFVNPLERGHIAFRTDDIAAFKKRLDEKGVPYSDYGTWAMNGWHQIFFHDPDGNVVEVHQANE